MYTEDIAQTVRPASTRRRRMWRAAAFFAGLVVIATGSTACGDASPRASSHSSSATTTTTATGTPSASAGSSGLPVNDTSKVLEFDQCMRAHGVVGFGEGGPTPGSTPPSEGMSYLGDSFNPDSPTYEAASQACAKYAVAEPVTPAGAAQVLQEQLKYAQCMQTHGVPDFPDPGSNGGFSVPSSIDQNSPAFQAAENACRSLLPIPPAPSGG